MKKTENSENTEVRISPSHPRWKEINMLVCMIAALKNPQAHFDTSSAIKFMEEENSAVDRILRMHDLEMNIQFLESELASLLEQYSREEFQRKHPAIYEFICSLDLDDPLDQGDVKLK